MKVIRQLFFNYYTNICKENQLYFSDGKTVFRYDLKQEKIINQIDVPFYISQIRLIFNKMLVSGNGNYVVIDFDFQKIEELIEIEDENNFYLSSLLIHNNYAEAFAKDSAYFFIFKYPELEIVTKFNLKNSGYCCYFKDYGIIENGAIKNINLFNYLTGETLWQRSFKELGIANLDKFIGDINNILICACGKTILGLDKNTGEELWRVNHYIELANAVLNQASGSIYLFYGWSGPENNFSENDNITFLEIDALTGEVLYDNSIFKHPNYLELKGLRHYEGTGDYPRFYNALQWKHKIYFIINSWHSSMVKIMEFDTVNKRISYLTEQSYEANSNSNWFIAEGKLFIQSRISQQIESEENPDPLYWSRIYSKSQFDGEHMQYQHFAISKESYLTIFDLEDN